MTIELAGMGELARMLGVSRTRTVQLTAEPDFPPPVAVLGVGRIYAVADLRAWADRKGRVLAPLDAPGDGAGDA